MKVRKQLFYCLLGGISIIVGLTACGSDEEMKLVNTESISIDSVANISLDYDADDLLIQNSKSKKIVLKEYMSRDKRKYYSQISQNNHGVGIKEGKRPIGSSFKSKMVLSVPKDYSGELEIHSTSGKVETTLLNKALAAVALDTTSGKISSNDLAANTIKLTSTSGVISSSTLIAKNKIKIKSTSGPINVQDVDAKEMKLQTTSADTKLKKIKGQVDYETKSGELTLSDFSGNGEFTASGEGSMTLKIKKLTDDLSAFSKNGTVTLNLPDSKKAQLSLKTKEGKIKNQRDDLTEGTKSSVPRINVETRNGNINVN
ncbi:DUF4097 family beta strand repeat-containing protein [Enterococcus hulanensis]|uniref:DUF4097 family beta strand repeat-containing protein n=1 Tax=Enterococcus hulanensis TaxID=2559929 RepID=UPI0014850C31|nr:DUF4097 family beta strand repeat-containing protein [Enterococcus hulanensis]